MTEDRAVPKPAPSGGSQRPIAVNPFTPGVQKPNKPDGRDAPSQGETR